MTTLANPVPRSGPLEHFEHGFNRVVVSSDSRLVATSDVDMNVVVREGFDVVFDANFGSDNDKIRPTERIRGLVFSPDGDMLYVAAGDELHAIRTNGWVSAWSYVAPRSFGFLIISPISLDVALNGDVAAAFDNGTLVVWNKDGLKKAVIRDNDSPRWLRFVAGGEEIVGSDSFSLCAWRVQRRKRRLKIPLADRVFGLDVDSAGLIAAGRTLQDIVVWNLEQKVILNTLPVGPGVPVLALHPSLQRLAYAERNRIRVVDFHGKLIEQFDLDVASALSMVFAPAGEELLIGCTEQKLIRRPVNDTRA